MISLCIFRRIRNISSKSCRENQTRILWSIMFFFRKSYCIWDDMVKYGRARQATYENITRRMRFSCLITKATDTHSEYLLITFPRKQWWRERTSILRYTYIAVSLSDYAFPTMSCCELTSVGRGQLLQVLWNVDGACSEVFLRCWVEGEWVR